MRTFAAPSGDGGRDAILLSPDGEPETIFQYSVTPEWNTKIRQTVRRLKTTAPQVRTLVYMSNQMIGAKGDGLRKEFRKTGLHLDIRDASYFLERADKDRACANAAAELARRIVDPLLEDQGVLSAQGVLNGREANTALLFVEMQQQDEAAGKSLTRSCFEALVKAALHASTGEQRITRSEVHKRVQAYLPQHQPDSLARFVDAALLRLKRQAVSQWAGKTEDEFHINHFESERLKDAAASLISMRDAFEQDVMEILENRAGVAPDDRPSLLSAIHRIVQIYFLRRGEEFAASVVLDADAPIHQDDLKSIVQANFPTKVTTTGDVQSFGVNVITTLLKTPSDRTRAYLRLLSDSYTLMSFLSATPDVETATRKLFNQGSIWIDTGVVLPVLAETKLGEDERPFTAMFRQARQCGAKLQVTWGVVEEIERHLNRCRAYAMNSNWEGDVPYVYASYILAGGEASSFSSWLENFIGSSNPVQDLADYLTEVLGFIVGEEQDTRSISAEIRYELSNYWREVHETRRNVEGQAYNLNIDKLARHDVENCLIVMAERLRDRKATKLGQQSWWLSLDRAATRMLNALQPNIRDEVGNLVLSLDFLMRYIAFGPNRERSSPEDRSGARVFAQPLMEVVPPELVRVAVKIREESAGLPDRLVRRRLRDAMDLERARIGPIHAAGLEHAADALLAGY